jgi:hypothetical protein
MVTGAALKGSVWDKKDFISAGLWEIGNTTVLGYLA